MNQITKQGTNGTRFAVSRVYQPARIERELLAQVFDLAGRGCNDHFEPSDDGQESAAMTVDGRSQGRLDSAVFSRNGRSQFAVLEDVA